MDRIERLINFYNLACSLKYKIRQGLIYWDIRKDRLESIAEHIYGTCILAISIDSEFDFNINIDKVIKMLVVHELEEIIIGDITPFDNISKEEKLLLGNNAVDKILEGLFKKQEYVDLINEFNLKITKESKFAYLVDKLECDLQIKAYEEMGYTYFYNTKNNPAINNNTIKEILKRVNNVADIFYEYDKDLFKEEEVFTKILDFVYKKY